MQQPSIEFTVTYFKQSGQRTCRRRLIHTYFMEKRNAKMMNYCCQQLIELPVLASLMTSGEKRL